MVRLTEAGLMELKAAKRGLSIPQRRLLLALETHPRLDVALEAEPLLRRSSLASDLGRLLELGLMVREQPAVTTANAGANPERVTRNVRRATPNAAAPKRRRHRQLMGIAAAIGVVSATGYLVFRAATRVGNAPVAPVAQAAPAARTSTTVDKPQGLPLPEAGSSNTPIPRQAEPIAAVRESATTKPAISEAKPTVAAQTKPQAQEERPADSPTEKPAAVASNLAQTVRTEATLDKSRSCPPPVYPAESLQNEEQGTVGLSFLIDVKGNVAEARIDSSSGHSRLDVAARDMLTKCHFKPGTVGGKPEATWARLRYTWRLE